MHAETFAMLDQMLSPKIPAQVRAAAATAAAAGCGEADFRRELGSTELGHKVLKRLLLLTADTATSRLVLSALVNAAEDEGAACALVAQDAVGRTAMSVQDAVGRTAMSVQDADARPLISLHSALLSNLTRVAAGCDALCKGPIAEARTLGMLARAHAIPSLLWAANLAATAAGRALLLRRGAAAAPLDRLLALLGDRDEARRFAVASAVRNCALAEDGHVALLERTQVLGEVLARFVTRKRRIDPDEMALAPRQVRAAYETEGALTPEPIEEIRLLLAEGVLLLCKSVIGRDALRADGAYAVLRAWHLEEESEKIREVIESVVDRTKLVDEDERVPNAVEEAPQISEIAANGAGE